VNNNLWYIMSQIQFHKYISWICKTDKGEELNSIRRYIVMLSGYDFHYRQERNEACIKRLLHEASIICTSIMT